MKAKPKEKSKLERQKTGGGNYALLFAAGIVLFTFFIFSAVTGFDFLNWDDLDFVVNNSPVTSLSFLSIRRMFTEFVSGNYCPLTTFSYALDFHFAGGFVTKYFHSMSLLIHLINTLLVFLFIYRLNGKQVMTAAITSLLFGIHPMHVESVAWVAERRDLLYTLFYLAGLICYLGYVKGSYSIKSLLFSLLLFIFSLFSKGQAVTFPVVLLLIDYICQRKMDLKSLAEKIPFFLLSLVFGYIAIRAQKTTPAVNSQHLSMLQSFFAGNYGLLLYLVKVVVPFKLTGLHPYPTEFSWVVKSAPLLILALIAAAWWKLKSERTITGGMLIFILTIFPVLQFMPVGDAIIAERYTYIPYIGLFFVIGFVFENREKYIWLRPVKLFLPVLLVGWFVVLSYITVTRTKVWRDKMTFWTDVIDHYPGSNIANNNRGTIYLQDKQYEAAMADFNRGISFDSTYSKLYLNRGISYERQNMSDSSLKDYNAAIRLDSASTLAHNYRGFYYYKKGMPEKAMDDFNASIRVDSNNTDAYIKRGIVFSDSYKQYDSGVKDFTKALSLDAGNTDALSNLGFAYYKEGKFDTAITLFNKLAMVNSLEGKALYFRALAYAGKKDFVQASADAQKAKELGYPVEENLIVQYEQLKQQQAGR